MKKIIYLIFLCFSFSFAQVQTPQPSPLQKNEVIIGLTNFSLEYSRPSMRGRTIFGELVPYGALWRTGANKNTIITFDDSVIIGGKEINSGSYSIYTRPSEKSWDVIFYNKIDNSGLPNKWEKSMESLVLNVKTKKTEKKVETFDIWFSNLHNDGASLNFAWENTHISILIKVPTKTKVISSINKTLSDSPKAGDYFNAARYHLQENIDLNKAEFWIGKSLDMQETFWGYRQQALIFEKLGEIDNAIDSAKKSINLAEKEGNKDYVLMNNNSISKWISNK